MVAEGVSIIQSAINMAVNPTQAGIGSCQHYLRSLFREVVMGTAHAQWGGLLLEIWMHGVVCKLAALSVCDKNHF